jgi:hypothetical protein
MLLFTSFLPAASADSVNTIRQTTLQPRQSGASMFMCVTALPNPTNEVRANGVHAELSEFWRETLAVVAGVRLCMANAIFPYLQRYHSKDLTDPGANVVLATQAQRNVFFFFHVRLTQRTMVWPPRRSHGLNLYQVFPV